ncbi:hypothetical protein LSH36_1282g00013 [Paralvinella palmiformis]|uniref:Uncharacterized protein n=1 Tax=Paralvinella palmiformis TaxID=53620 RepID=A0AAD9MNT4_9ANNE|nr:hypothetical protein LSH36_1282g00013 [Paralvinella palmiformis]
MVSVSRFQAVVTGRGIWAWHFVSEWSVCRWTAPQTHRFTCCRANLTVQACVCAVDTTGITSKHLV